MRNLKPLVALLAALLAAGIVLAATGTLYRNCVDRWGLNAVLATRTSGRDHAMLKLSDLWSNENYLESAVSIAAHGDDRAYAWLESSAKAIAVSEALVSSTKFVVGRRRPDGHLKRSNSSFPSSHASSAFAFATTLALHYPQHAAKIFEIACHVGISRIYLERHYPSDVLGGAAIGVASALASEAYLFWLRFDRSAVQSALMLIPPAMQPEPVETPLFRLKTPAE